EQVIATIWADVLKLDQVGIHDNFFELGGHSLLAMILIERIRQQGFHAEVRSLFITKTLAGFVAVLNESVLIEVPENRIPTPCQHITPDMLPLVSLQQIEIDAIVQRIAHGVENIQDIYPLTPFQEGILFHHLITAVGDPYLLSSMLAFETRDSLDRFLNALQAVINRHDILRTAVLWEELPVPVQVVLRQVTLPITEITLNPVLGDVAKQLQEQFDPRHFRLDVRRAPLIHGYTTWDEQHNRWLLLILEHHLALDHVAMEVVLKEVSAYLFKQFDQLSQPLPFGNFVAQTRLREKHEEHEAFFKRLLGNVDEPTAPFGLLDVKGEGVDIAEAIIDLDVVFDQRIRICSKLMNVSAASVFHLAWAQVLALISGRETVVFGTVLFGRTQQIDEADRMLGMFINTLPVCFDITRIGCKAGIHRMHRLLAELMRHEHASLALAQRCSAVPPPTPLFSTLLNYRHSIKETNSANEISASVWESMGISVLDEDERTNYPFTLSIDDFGSGFRITMQVQSPIEPQRIMGYLYTALTGLVDALIANPNKALCTIDVLPKFEREQLLVEWNQIKANCMQGECIHELFEQQARNHSESIAVVFEGKQLTYGELNIQANQIAYDLRTRGVGPEVLVGLLFERSLEMIVAILGVLKAGGAYLPIDPNYPQDRIAFIVDDAKPKVMLTQSVWIELIPGDIEIFCLDQALSERSCDHQENPLPIGTSHNLAYVIYTSGSTGKPKGVMVTHHNVRRLFANTELEYGFGHEDVWTLFHSYAFDFSVWEIWGALLYGGRLIVVPDLARHSSEAFHRLLLEQRVTVLNQTPTSFYQLDIADKRVLIRNSLALRLVIFGGEALELGKLREWFERHGESKPQLVNMYGITETTVHVTWAPLTQADSENTGSSMIGRAISDLQTFILDGQGNAVPLGVSGELYIGGLGLARGYLNRADLTADRFVPHPFDASGGARLYRTGDLARYRENGNIEYLGRIDHQVKIRGFRIELGEIENFLAQHSMVRESVVVAREDVEGEKRLVAYVASDELKDQDAGIDSLRMYLKERLPDYMVPAAFVFLDTLPLTPNGKIDQKALPQPDIFTQIVDRYVAPRTQTEEVIAQIWAEVLGLKKVGIHDNFFELGGHSLLATQVMSRLHGTFSVSISYREAFEATTIASLANVIEAAKQQELKNIPDALNSELKYEDILI
ncbi:MAG: amino acid adenylation domain-containing protein, partial [Nitrosomonas sp.]